MENLKDLLYNLKGVSIFGIRGIDKDVFQKTETSGCTKDCH